MLIRKLLCCWITLSLAPLAWCNDEDEPEIWYQVELIVFEQADMFGDEQPRRNVKLYYPENSRELIVPDAPTEHLKTEPSASGINDLPNLDTELSNDIIGPQPDETPAQELPFIQLDNSLHQLTPDARALDRRDSYRVLYHQAWRQPGTSRRQTPWVLVRGGERYGDHFELEGSVRLLKSRYLHIETRLWLTRFGNNVSEQEGWPELPAWPILPVFDEMEYPQQTATLPSPSVARIYTLNMSRRIQKTGQLHYLDHPNLGVLVQVTRYKLPETESADQLMVPDIEDEIDNVSEDIQADEDQD